MADNRIHLTDDGTMDTVLRCEQCGEEFRFSALEAFEDVPDDEVAETDGHYWWPIDNRDEETNGLAPALPTPRFLNREAAVLEYERIEREIHTHECAGPGFTEPSEDDLTTEDHRTFYQYGRVAFALTETDAGPLELASVRPNHRGQYLTGTYASVEDAVRAYMEHDKFWPNVWFISDHGNAHRMEV